MQEGSAAEVCHPQRSEVYPSLGRGAQNKDQEVLLMGRQKAPGQVLLPTVTRQQIKFLFQAYSLRSDYDVLLDAASDYETNIQYIDRIMEDPVDFIETFPANYDGSPNITMDQVWTKKTKTS